MRRLWRPSIVPPTLAEGGAGYRVDQENRQSRHVDPQAHVTTGAGHWRKTDVRGALRSMQGWACAYCQGPGLEDVDHFRPKQHYWWLAYTFSNYFLSCVTCNSRRKGSRFPLARGTRRLTFATENTIDQEQRLLIDPAIDPVEDWMQTELEDFRIENVADPNDPTARSRVDETIRFFWLNRSLDLRHQRKEKAREALSRLEILEAYEAEANTLDDDDEQEIRIELHQKIRGDRDKLRGMAMRHSPHASTVRAVLAGREDLLPTVKEEVCWLAGSFLDLLRLDHGEIDRAEICWALAVLWKDPPAETSEIVESQITTAGQLDKIQPCYDTL